MKKAKSKRNKSEIFLNYNMHEFVCCLCACFVLTWIHMLCKNNFHFKLLYLPTFFLSNSLGSTQTMSFTKIFQCVMIIVIVQLAKNGLLLHILHRQFFKFSLLPLFNKCLYINCLLQKYIITPVCVFSCYGNLDLYNHWVCHIVMSLFEWCPLKQKSLFDETKWHI